MANNSKMILDINFKDSIEIKSIEDYITFLKRVHFKKYYFRGVSKKEQIYSTLLRKKIMANEKNIITEIDEIESELVRKFEDNASIWTKDYNNPIDLIATAQHLELKTRYKDWTLSILIATLFSLYNSKSRGYYVLFNDNKQFVQVKNMPYDNCFTMAKNNVKYESQKQRYIQICEARTKLWNNQKVFQLINDILNKKYIDSNENYYNKFHNEDDINLEIIMNYFYEIFKNTNSNITKCKKLAYDYTIYYIMAEKLLIEAKISNDRILNQKGLFEYDDYDIFYSSNPRQELVDLYNEKSFYGVLIINKKIRNELIEFISKLGITYMDIMKDATSTSKYLNLVYYEKDSPKTVSL